LIFILLWTGRRGGRTSGGRSGQAGPCRGLRRSASPSRKRPGRTRRHGWPAACRHPITIGRPGRTGRRVPFAGPTLPVAVRKAARGLTVWWTWPVSHTQLHAAQGPGRRSPSAMWGRSPNSSPLVGCLPRSSPIWKGSAAVRQPAVGPLTGGPACVGPTCQEHHCRALNCSGSRSHPSVLRFCKDLTWALHIIFTSLLRWLGCFCGA